MAPRNRSLTGCGTCRTRHLKCDETRPGCQMCQVLGQPCPGYRPQLKWTQDLFQPESQNEGNGDRVFRRSLFGENEQESMTRMTIDSLGRQSANKALESLDHDHEGSSKATLLPNSSLFRGPFGVLNFMLDSAPPDDQPKLGTNQVRPQKREPVLLYPTSNVTPTVGADRDTRDPGSIDSDPRGHPPGPVFSLNEDTITNDGFSEPPLDIQVNGSIMFSPSVEFGVSPIPFFSPFSPTTCRLVPDQAPELLRYFRNNIVSLSFPITDSRKCPWQTVHLPSAEKAYAELLLYQTANHTSLSLFYSLLAASCHHLSCRSESFDGWNKFGKSYKQIAKHHLRCAVGQEIIGSERIKYKELLMALLSMVMLEVLCGQYNDAQNLLVEAECLIRKRGLQKPHKSLKLRALHHVYAYLRIMAESTCGCALLNICPERPSSSLASAESSFKSLRSFRVADNSTETDLDMNAEKGIEIGHNDIHLEVMGTWKESLFPEIYGLPESLMGLLSQTIRLANEQELLHHDTALDVDIFINLTRRSKILEHHILSWKPSQRHPNSPEADPANESCENDNANARATYYTALAVHQGLILFYYRRVQNINALILQDTVRKVLDFIRQSDESTMEHGIHGPSSLWPCFIAACEAVDPELRSFLLEWLLATGRRTSIPSFAAGANVVQKVWEMRKETHEYTFSWFDVVNQDHCPIIAV